MTLRWILALSACLMTPLAQAGGPTDEDEAHADWAHLHPLRAESADGQWQVSVNAKGELLRQRRGAGSPPQALRVGLNVHALATHGDASQVLLRLHNGCLLQADFRRSPATLKVHLASKLTAGPSPDSACTARPALDERFAHFSPTALALSPDGKRLALVSAIETHPGAVRVIDLAQPRELARLPIGGEALQLEFLEHGKVLRVLGTLRGMYWEDTANPSFLVASLWDSHSGALLNWAERPGAFVNAPTYANAWSRGEQWWIEPAGGVQAVALAECPARRSVAWQLPEGQTVLDMAVDPHGRWLALLVREGAAQARLQWHEARAGHLLARETPAAGTHWGGLWVQPDGQGLLLLPYREPQSKEWKYPERDSWLRQPWMARALPAAVQALPALGPGPVLRTQPCAEAGEAPQARQPLRLDKAPQVLRRMALPDPAEPPPRDLFCRQELEPGASGDPLARRWGTSPDGLLWLDLGPQLQRIDPVSGRQLAPWPTPRMAGACSTPSFARQQFLNWQGDTLSLRPFAPTLQAQTRQLVDRRPGWIVESAVWLGDLALVRWIRKGDGERPARRVIYELSPEGRGIERSAEDGIVPKETPLSFFSGDESMASLPAWFALLAPLGLTPDEVERQHRGVREPLRWRQTRFGSVRAERGGRLLLWDGVAGQAPSAVAQSRLEFQGRGTQLLDLGQGRALAFAQRAVDFYALEGERATVWHWANLGSETVDDAAWLPGQGLLVLQRGKTLEVLRPLP